MNFTSKRLLLATVAFFFAVFQMSAQVSLSVKNKEIRFVIQQIEKGGEYRFFYSSDLPGLDKIISVKAENKRFQMFLIRCSRILISNTQSFRKDRFPLLHQFLQERQLQVW